MDRIDGADAIRLEHLSVSFAGQKALDDVSVSIGRGKVTALLGMNGSGKSTLIKVLAGIYAPDDGAQLFLDGTRMHLPLTPKLAHEHGLRFLHQDVGLVQQLTVADNFAFVDRFQTNPLGAIERRRQHRRVQAALDRFGLPVEPGQLVSDLNPTLQTMVGVARAFQGDDGEASAFEKNILILDEPTASLPGHEVEALLQMVEDLRAQGGTVIYVSHRSEEVKRLADQLVILRDGRLVADEPAGDLTIDELVTRIVGHRVEKNAGAQRSAARDQVVLETRGLSGPRLRDVDLTVHAGEIVGVTGLVGCGRSELVRILSGAQQPTGGAVSIDGTAFSPRSPFQAIGEGVASVPQERRRDGVVLPMSVVENLTLGNLGPVLSRGYLGAAREKRVADGMRREYSIKAADMDAPVGLLSGGNQQKVVVARAASHRSALLLLDEPTQGVDVHAKEEIADIIRRLAADGVAIILASTDFEGFVGLCDRVVVLDRGAVFGTLEGADITEAGIAALCARSGALVETSGS
ncbi:sugar ABC transporter ATP-binding protein [Agromyces tropicus]|uniref:Sugar ABC transporter ATP-binding protein n=1 Tax=Agromyces tropicus TaxID=555371 RepID=A0ABP5FKW1_9MICO